MMRMLPGQISSVRWSLLPPARFPIVSFSGLCSDPSVESDDKLSKTVNLRIKGTVQGVSYRQWTIEAAQRLGLDGWVRNRRDGTVEAVFSGKPDAVDSMIENCRSGPPAARVSAVDFTLSKESVPKGFRRRATE